MTEKKKKEEPQHIYNAGKFARNLIEFISTSNSIAMTGTKAEVSLYLLHMQMLLQILVRENKLHAFTNMLFEKCQTMEGLEQSYVEFIATLAATGASGEAQTSIRLMDHPGTKGEQVLKLFLDSYDIDEKTKTQIGKFAFAFIRAYRDYLKRGVISDSFALKAFSSYLLHAVLITHFAVEEGFIPGLNEDLVLAYGIQNPQQARYVAEFLNRATNDVLVRVIGDQST